MAELVDALVSGTSGSNTLEVRVFLCPPYVKKFWGCSANFHRAQSEETKIEHRAVAEQILGKRFCFLRMAKADSVEKVKVLGL